MKTIARVLITSLLIFSTSALITAGERTLEVAVGDTIAQAKMTKKHSITIAALEKGKTEYSITVDGDKHAITLSETQVQNILAGTTVNLEAHGKKIRITLKTKKEKRSGW